MAITHYIDTTAPEIARARIKSTTNRVPEGFPTLIYGDTRNHNFVFYNAQTGSVESFSGNASYSLRVTIGETQLGPTSGSYTITCGANTTGLIDALSDAETIKLALNNLAQITTDGGVVVTGTFPNFLVTWNKVGAVTGLSSNASLLLPASSVSIVQTQTGSANVANQVAIVLRQAAITSQTTWSLITSPQNGWTGTLTTNTAAALILLSTQGQQVGEFVEVGTCLTAEVLDSGGTPISYYQTPIILRAKNLDPSNTTSPAFSSYNLGDTLYGNSSNTLSRLPGATTTQRKFYSQAGDGTNSAQPNWVAIQASDLPNTELPGGTNQSVQFNDSNSFWGDSVLIYDKAAQKIGSAGLRYVGVWTDQINASNVNTGVIPNAQLPTGTGTGLLVYQTSPNIVTPNIGAASASALTVTGLASPNVVLGGGVSPLSTSDISYASPNLTTPDAFAISSAGSIALEAGGSNKNITLTPATTGFVSVVGAGVRLDNTAKSLPAWGVTGPAYSTTGRTYTDSSSSGTVASAVANSFAIPTFAASSSTTFTNAANLYIAGDVANGTNVTLTNSYGLWNVGKTRLDGILKLNTAVFDGSNSTSITGGAGNMTITAGTGNSRTLALQGTSSGGAATTFLTGTDTGFSLPSTATSGAQLYNTSDQTTNVQRWDMFYGSGIAQFGTRTIGTATGTPLFLYSQQTNAATAYARADIQSIAFPFFRQGYYTSGTNTTVAQLSTTGTLANFSNVISTATSGSFIGFSITPTYNQASGSAANTDFLVNRSETAIGTGAQYLADFQIGGNSVAHISRAGIGLASNTNATQGVAATDVKKFKQITAIADNTATDVFTVTVPNAAHSGTLRVTLSGSLGSGGAVGANEATGNISYDFAITRTSGVATVVGASSAYGSSTASVAGAATITITAAASGMTGATSATQTFTIQVTIAHGSGSSTNHTCRATAELINANATGITVS